MTIVLVVLAIVAIDLLILVAAIVIRPSQYSPFELERLHREDKASVGVEYERMLHFNELASLQRVAVAVLLVVSVSLLIAALGWLWGILAAVVLALGYGTVARASWVRTFANKRYETYEPQIIARIKRYPKIASLFVSAQLPESQLAVHSHEELLELVKRTSGSVLSGDERALIANGLQFGQRKVSEIMTPRSVIDVVKKGEILGPLVLDDLHKTGHSRFPVIANDLDHVVGVLMLRDVLTLDTTRKHTAKVETAMDGRVHYIKETQTLEHALAAFLKTHHHLFVVVNEYRETVGIVCLEDVVEALLGRKIVDEFDAHEDLRAVAARNPRGNNQPHAARDV